MQIDRSKAADLGVSVETIGRTLEAMFGAREVNTYVDRGETENWIKDLKNHCFADRLSCHTCC